MKTNVWIWNHYATGMFRNQGGRHYWFAENLRKKGYKATIFCSSASHNSVPDVETGGRKYITDTVDGIPFVFVKTVSYRKNGFRRIRNMVSFYRNLFPVAKSYAKINGKPDIILASSVHPLTLVAGIQIAKKLGVPCICEVRDLWPESLVAYGMLKKDSVLAKVLYRGEKWIYKRADSIIMTWEGGKDYIADKGWENWIDISKIHHISNGVVIDSFDRNSEEYRISDPDLDDGYFKNIIYAGAIRKVNNLGLLLDAAKIIQNQGVKDIRFMIYGGGDELEKLVRRCKEEGIQNVVFKGEIGKMYVPFVIKKAYINILHNMSTTLDKYGQSQNKLFEYLAAGRCIVQTYRPGYSICDRSGCGISAAVQTAQEIAATVMSACSDDDACCQMGKNARKAANEYDFNCLTEKLIDIIESA